MRFFQSWESNHKKIIVMQKPVIMCDYGLFEFVYLFFI